MSRFLIEKGGGSYLPLQEGQKSGVYSARRHPYLQEVHFAIAFPAAVESALSEKLAKSDLM